MIGMLVKNHSFHPNTPMIPVFCVLLLFILLTNGKPTIIEQDTYPSISDSIAYHFTVSQYYYFISSAGEIIKFISEKNQIVHSNIEQSLSTEYTSGEGDPLLRCHIQVDPNTAILFTKSNILYLDLNNLKIYQTIGYPSGSDLPGDFNDCVYRSDLEQVIIASSPDSSYFAVLTVLQYSSITNTFSQLPNTTTINSQISSTSISIFDVEVAYVVGFNCYDEYSSSCITVVVDPFNFTTLRTWDYGNDYSVYHLDTLIFWPSSEIGVVQHNDQNPYSLSYVPILNNISETHCSTGYWPTLVPSVSVNLPFCSKSECGFLVPTTPGDYNIQCSWNTFSNGFGAPSLPDYPTAPFWSIGVNSSDSYNFLLGIPASVAWRVSVALPPATNTSTQPPIYPHPSVADFSVLNGDSIEFWYAEGQPISKAIYTRDSPSSYSWNWTHYHPSSSFGVVLSTGQPGVIASLEFSGVISIRDATSLSVLKSSSATFSALISVIGFDEGYIISANQSIFYLDNNLNVVQAYQITVPQNVFLMPLSYNSKYRLFSFIRSDYVQSSAKICFGSLTSDVLNCGAEKSSTILSAPTLLRTYIASSTTVVKVVDDDTFVISLSSIFPNQVYSWKDQKPIGTMVISHYAGSSLVTNASLAVLLQSLTLDYIKVINVDTGDVITEVQLQQSYGDSLVTIPYQDILIALPSGQVSASPIFIVEGAYTDPSSPSDKKKQENNPSIKGIGVGGLIGIIIAAVVVVGAAGFIFVRYHRRDDRDYQLVDTV